MYGGVSHILCIAIVYKCHYCCWIRLIFFILIHMLFRVFEFEQLEYNDNINNFMVLASMTIVKRWTWIGADFEHYNQWGGRGKHPRLEQDFDDEEETTRFPRFGLWWNEPTTDGSSFSIIHSQHNLAILMKIWSYVINLNKLVFHTSCIMS